MGIKKIVSVLFQVPAWILLVGSVFVGFYAYVKQINDIGIVVPIILMLIFVLYIIGRVMARNKENNTFEEQTPNYRL